jgi:hypothetical protein
MLTVYDVVNVYGLLFMAIATLLTAMAGLVWQRQRKLFLRTAGILLVGCGGAVAMVMF